MVGYQGPYTHLGWFSARLEDGLTWLPCRLTVLTLALMSGRPAFGVFAAGMQLKTQSQFRLGECAYAAVLGVQMGVLVWWGS